MSADDTFSWPERCEPLRQAMGDPNLTGMERRVFAIMWTFAGPDGDGARPGVELLADLLTVHVRSVRKAIQGLIARGYLVVTAQPNRRGGKATTYRVQVPGAESFSAPQSRALKLKKEERGSTGALPRSRADARSFARPNDASGGREELRHYGNPEDNEDLFMPRPEPYCDAHPGGTTDKCWKCGEARRGLQEWLEDKSWRTDVFRERAKIRDCSLCDDEGYLPDHRLVYHTTVGDKASLIPCQHTQSANEDWIAKVMARPSAPTLALAPTLADTNESETETITESAARETAK